MNDLNFNRSQTAEHLQHQSPVLPVDGNTQKQKLNDDGMPETFSAAIALVGPAMPAGMTLIRELGRGGMGIVYLVRQERLKRDVAVKRLLIETANSSERFRTEAEAVARLRHPNVVQVYESGVDDAGPYCVLEYVTGGSLKQRIASSSLPVMDAARLVAEAARGVHAAHCAGILHRDLKPDNILLDAEGVPKVSDFGLAKLLDADSGQTRSGDIMGTPSFMAPEQARGDTSQVGPKTDVWALGAILYVCLTGKVPFAGTTLIETLRQVQTLEPIPLRSLNPRCPTDLQTICGKCLEKNPARRYASAADLANDLDRWRNGEAILARPASMVRRTRRFLVRRRMPLAAAAVVTAIAAGAVMAWNGTRDRNMATLTAAARTALDQFDGSPAALPATDDTITALARRDADAANTYRTAVASRLRARTTLIAARPRLTNADEAEYLAIVDILRERDPSAVGSLLATLESRKQQWQTVFHLTADGNGDADALFEPGSLKFADGVWSKEVGTWFALSKVPCGQSARIHATFAHLASRTEEFGVWLNGGGDAVKPAEQHWRAYRFIIERDAAAGEKRKPLVAGEPAIMKIKRDNVVLQSERIIMPRTPITMSGQRTQNRLEFILNDLAPLTVVDAFPLRQDRSGVFGVMAANGTQFSNLRAEQQTLPSQPSTLELADQAFTAGKYQEALDLYRRQSGGTEADYKTGLCLLRLKQSEPAAEILQRALMRNEEQWSLMAGGQLLLLRRAQTRDADFNQILGLMGSRFPAGSLGTVLDEEQRRQLSARRFAFGSAAFFVTEKTIENAEASERLLTLLNSSVWERTNMRTGLIRLYHVNGQIDRALKLAENTWTELAESSDQRSEIIRELIWLQRIRGQAQLSRPIIMQYPHSGKDAVYYPIELIRTSIALRDWTRAANEVTLARKALVQPGSRLTYLSYAQIGLLEGFIREQAGDTAGAKKAWQASTPQGWQLAHPDRNRDADYTTMNPSSFNGQVHNLIAASLSDTLSDTEAISIFHSLLLGIREDAAMKQVAALMKPTPAAIRRAFTSPRGRELAKQIACRSISAGDCVRLPVYRVAAELLREQAKLPDDDATMESLMKLAQQSLDLYVEGRLTKTQLLQIGLAWSGTVGSFGWGAVAPSLPPALRSRFAWLLAHRCEQLGQYSDAKILFAQAIIEADPDLKSLLDLKKSTPRE